VPLEEPGLGAAQRLQGDLRDRVPAVRWARPETLHLTIHFFGQIDDRRAATAHALVEPVAHHTFSFDVVLDRLDAFPQRGTPHVLWLGPARDVPELTALALECRDVLGGAGFDVEKRPFHPHCTLGRPRIPWSDTARTAWTAAAAEPRPDVRFTASRLVLFESRSAPGGAVYAERSSLLFASG
jgi:2'-5' RNA ligase